MKRRSLLASGAGGACGMVRIPLAAAQAVFDLAQRHGAPTALQAIGMQRSDLRRARELAMQAQYPNPRPLEADALDALLLNAFEGRRPG